MTGAIKGRRGRSAIRRFTLARVTVASAAVLTAAGCFVAAPLPASAASSSGSSTPATITGKAYPGDPAKEAAIVAAEEQRLYSVSAIAAAARWRGISVAAPYRILIGQKPTLVLVSRPQPYGLADLQALIPDGFVKQPDSSFLLSNDIVVQQGATLALADPDGLVVHLSSSAKGFNSIVAMGGSISITGSKKAPVRINAWDPTAGVLDTDTTDGRGYIRVIGGSATFTWVRFDHLGFWSGLTGGLSLTGTQATPSETATAAVPPPPETKGDKVHGAQLLPTGNIADVASAIESTAVGYSYVTALLSHVTSDNNAFGLFVNSSDGIKVADSEFNDNLVDGLVLHRFVTNSTITSSSTRNNAVDGFAMTRAATGIVVNQLLSSGNGRDGISLNGGPLASGPNATGSPTGSYGNNTLSDSTSRNNARYGVVVLGGSNVKITDNEAASNLMGIVVSRAATLVTVRGNTVENSTKHGIALFDGVTKSTVKENSVSGAITGIYLRDSHADVLRNRVSDVTLHAVTLVGASAATTVVGNQLAGSGSNAIDRSRSTGVEVGKNDLRDWVSTRPLLATLRSIFQPLTVLWIVLGLIVLISAISSIGRRRTGIDHPYASHVPLTSLTPGIVDPRSVGFDPTSSVDPRESAAPPPPGPVDRPRANRPSYVEESQPVFALPAGNYGTN